MSENQHTSADPQAVQDAQDFWQHFVKFGTVCVIATFFITMALVILFGYMQSLSEAH